MGGPTAPSIGSMPLTYAREPTANSRVCVHCECVRMCACFMIRDVWLLQALGRAGTNGKLAFVCMRACFVLFCFVCFSYVYVSSIALIFFFLHRPHQEDYLRAIHEGVHVCVISRWPRIPVGARGTALPLYC